MDTNHCGYIVKVKDLRPHSNADRLQIATFFGNDTCVSLDVKVGDIGIYFPTGLQLDADFCDVNHLCRKNQKGEKDTGYLDGDKRNVDTIRLRGEPSDGTYLPLSCLSSFGDISTLKVGDIVSEFNGHPICQKYIPRTNKQNKTNSQGISKTRKHKDPIAPLFSEHIDTAQLAYNLNAFKPGDLIEITRKLHGTSARIGYLPVLKGYKRTLWDKITRKDGKPIYQYDYINGTRRTIICDWDGGFYGSNEFRKHAFEAIKGKLHEGEEIFMELVGFTDDGVPIMGSVSNKKTNDKAFIKQYGDMTTFSYGCDPTGVTAPKNDFYVYRMTLTTHDGYTVEYSPEYTRYRCEQMGVKFVPVEWRGYIPEHPASENDDTISAGEWIMNKAEQYYDGPEPIDPRHVREGVVVRLVDKPSFTAYKIKNFSFKLISGIAVTETNPVDETIAEEL
jgi:hypothetical protein